MHSGNLSTEESIYRYLNNTSIPTGKLPYKQLILLRVPFLALLPKFQPHHSQAHLQSEKDAQQ